MGDYLTREEQRELLNWYKERGYKRFHSMNAATYDDNGLIEFCSYKTTICYAYECANVYLMWPNVHDYWKWSQTRTTNKQFMRWIHEYTHDNTLTLDKIRELFCYQNNGDWHHSGARLIILGSSDSHDKWRLIKNWRRWARYTAYTVAIDTLTGKETPMDDRLKLRTYVYKSENFD